MRLLFVYMNMGEAAKLRDLFGGRILTDKHNATGRAPILNEFCTTQGSVLIAHISAVNTGVRFPADTAIVTTASVTRTFPYNSPEMVQLRARVNRA